MKMRCRWWPWIIGLATVAAGYLLGLLILPPGLWSSSITPVGPSATSRTGVATSGATSDTTASPVDVTAKYAPATLNQAWLASPFNGDEGIPQPPDNTNCDHLTDWIRSTKMVDRNSSQVTVTIRANKEAAITVNAIRPRIRSQQLPRESMPVLTCVPFNPYTKKPFDGTYLPKPDQDGALDGNSKFTLDVKASFVLGESFRLEAGQIEEAYLTGFALACDCQWRIQLDLLVDGHPQTVVAGNGYEPFRTVALPQRKLVDPRDKVWCLVQGRTVLVPPDPRRCPAPKLRDKPIY